MKTKILTLVCCALVSLSALAQEHLTFKGIPMTGSITSFCQKLQAKGLKSMEKKDGIHLFTGDFTGRHATIGVGATDDGQNVFSVTVVFDPAEEWGILVDTYDYYKNLYTRKYNEPAASVENNPAIRADNIFLMKELIEGMVSYASSWNVPGGNIELSIQSAGDYFRGVVVIKYQDSQNVEAKIQSDLDEI